MSRVGKEPIGIPKGVDVSISGTFVEVKGPKGNLNWSHPLSISVDIKDGKVFVSRPDNTKQKKALHGLTRSLVANMVQGVSEGYKREIEILGIGYKVDLKGNTLIFSLGYSHPVEFKLPEGITAEVNYKVKPLKLILNGIDKQHLGQVAANIRSLKPPDSYKGKGIRYAGERLKLKPGKVGKT